MRAVKLFVLSLDLSSRSETMSMAAVDNVGTTTAIRYLFPVLIPSLTHALLLCKSKLFQYIS